MELLQLTVRIVVSRTVPLADVKKAPLEILRLERKWHMVPPVLHCLHVEKAILNVLSWHFPVHTGLENTHNEVVVAPVKTINYKRF